MTSRRVLWKDFHGRSKFLGRNALHFLKAGAVAPHFPLQICHRHICFTREPPLRWLTDYIVQWLTTGGASPSPTLFNYFSAKKIWWDCFGARFAKAELYFVYVTGLASRCHGARSQIFKHDCTKKVLKTPGPFFLSHPDFTVGFGISPNL